jgi:hypothetical protein
MPKNFFNYAKNRICQKISLNISFYLFKISGSIFFPKIFTKTKKIFQYVHTKVLTCAVNVDQAADRVVFASGHFAPQAGPLQQPQLGKRSDSVVPAKVQCPRH